MRDLRNRGLTVLGVIFTLLHILSAPASAQGTGDMRSLLGKEAQIVRAAYGRLAELSVSTDTPLTFKLVDFKTIAAEDFSSTELFDVLTLEGDLLQIERRTLTNARTGERRVEYIPSWIEEIEPFLESKAALDWRVETMTVADLLSAKASEDEEPEIEDGHSLTTYQVTVTTGGKTRTYRAAFLWLSDPVQKTVEFRVLDRVTPRVDDAAVERLPQVGNRDEYMGVSQEEDAEGLRLSELSLKSGPGFTECTEETNNILFPWSQTRTTDHLTGSHKLGVTLGVQCKCLGGTSPDCTSTCQGIIQSASCSGSGITVSSNHCFRADSDATFDSSNSLSQGPACGSAYTCGVKACLFCLCTFSVSVSWSGSWSFSGDAGLVDQFKAKPVNNTLTCLPCAEGIDNP